MKCFFCGEENQIVLENHHLIPRRLNKAVFSKNAAKTEKRWRIYLEKAQYTCRGKDSCGRHKMDNNFVMLKLIKWIAGELYEVI
jgi:hypothetical protein